MGEPPPWTGDVARQGFMKQAHRDMLIVSEALPHLIESLRAYAPPVVPKWIRPDER